MFVLANESIEHKSLDLFLILFIPIVKIWTSIEHISNKEQKSFRKNEHFYVQNK